MEEVKCFCASAKEFIKHLLDESDKKTHHYYADSMASVDRVHQFYATALTTELRHRRIFRHECVLQDRTFVFLSVHTDIFNLYANRIWNQICNCESERLKNIEQ